MEAVWGAAFTAAAVVTLVAVPALRRLARAAGLLDHPAERKVHTDPVPYLGGVAIIWAVLAGLVMGPARVATAGAVIGFAAATLAVVGLLDDHRGLSATSRLAAQTAAAVAAVTVGVRISVTGLVVWDVVATVVVIVAIANAFNLLDNMDGLSAGVGAVAATGAFVIAAGGGQRLVATLAAATAGACLGFLAYNSRPASIFMGDAGSHALGFLLAVAAIGVDPDLVPPTSWVVPALLLGVPIADTATVVVARTRRGIPWTTGGRDHLSHRLVARGLSPGAAVAILVAAQAALAAAAVAAAARVVPPAVAAAAGVAVTAAVVVPAARAAVYPGPRPARSPGVRRAAATVAVVVAVLAAAAAPAVWALWSVRPTVLDAVAAAEAAAAAARAGDTPGAAAGFERAAEGFASARRRLGGVAGIGLGVPVVGPNLDVARRLVAAGERLSATAAEVAVATDPDRLAIRGGRIPTDAAAEIAPVLEDAARVIDATHARIAGLDRPYLHPDLTGALDRLRTELDGTADDTRAAALAARLIGPVAGTEGPRRYFLAVQNPTEARGSGGFIGNWGILEATGGTLRLTRFARSRELSEPAQAAGIDLTDHAPADYLARYGRFEPHLSWQNVNMSPDWPTDAAVIASMYEAVFGTPLDGVIAVDPAGMARMLELTGPVTVARWPEPITAANVERVTLFDQYAAFGDDIEAREAFLGEVAEAVWRAFLSADLGGPATVGPRLADAVAGRHLMVWFADPAEQALAEVLGADGSLPPVRSDSLAVITQNAAGNKADWWLQRDITLDVTLAPDPDATTATVTGTLAVTLTNDAPPAPGPDAPAYMLGPYDERFMTGENRTYLSIYTPHGFNAARLDGRPVGLESATEAGRNVYSAFISIPPGATRTLTLELTGTAPLGPGGWWALDLIHQPLVHPDTVTVTATAADGWRITDTAGWPETRSGPAATVTGTMAPSTDTTVWARLEPPPPGWWDRLWSRRP